MDAKGLASYYGIYSGSMRSYYHPHQYLLMVTQVLSMNQVHSYWIFGIIERVNYTLLANHERTGHVNKLFILVSCKLNDLTTFVMINPSYSTQ